MKQYNRDQSFVKSEFSEGKEEENEGDDYSDEYMWKYYFVRMIRNYIIRIEYSQTLVQIFFDEYIAREIASQQEFLVDREKNFQLVTDIAIAYALSD